MTTFGLLTLSIFDTWHNGTQLAALDIYKCDSERYFSKVSCFDCRNLEFWALTCFSLAVK
jgi:hypothetical protein